MKRRSSLLSHPSARLSHVLGTLKPAWHQIFANGIQSKSKETRNGVKDYKKAEDRNLRKLSDRLRNGTFAFAPAKAVLVGKKLRPIVLADVESRIVQRALLDILQKMPDVQRFLDVPTSFGAISKKGVPAAIASAKSAIDSGATHYIKSDIKSFFTQIRRAEVLKKLRGFISDDAFLKLLESATNAEISNIESIPPEKRTYFDFDEVGTPQGCCLSPLFGNILLFEFDGRMNETDLKCLRYLDDFIIFGPSGKAVHAGFRKAKGLLEGLGLDVYDPNKDVGKASFGETKNRFEYLGVEIHDQMLRPAPNAVDRLITEIDLMIKDSKRRWAATSLEHSLGEQSFLATLSRINNKVKGWGNQYYFCNDVEFFRAIDVRIDSLVKKCIDGYMKRRRQAEAGEGITPEQRRRLLGVQPLIDRKTADLPQVRSERLKVVGE